MTDKVNKATGTEKIDTTNKIIEQKGDIVSDTGKKLVDATGDSLGNIADGIKQDLVVRF